MHERQIHVLGSKLDLFSVEEVFVMLERRFRKGEQSHIVTINPEICLLAEANESYQKVLNRADLGLADGVGIRVGAFLLGIQRPERITGRMVADALCQLAVKLNEPVFLLGGKDGVAQAAGDALRARWPNLKIAGAETGPDAQHFTLKDDELRKRIQASGARILLVAFGAPKQEEWIAANKKALPGVKIFVGVGGLFDYESGAVAKPPLWVQNLGVEWAFRLFTQRGRVKRVWRATAVFLSRIIVWKIRTIFIFRKNVVAMIIDQSHKRVLVVSPWWSEETRWQFPQGGVDAGESSEAAVMREMREELGTDLFRILDALPQAHKYTWPHWYRFVKGYRGQVQDLYLLEFTGQDADIQLGKTNELSRWEWIGSDELLLNLAPARREIGQIGLTLYERHKPDTIDA